MSDERPTINLSGIPVRGGLGALALVVLLLAAMAAELPAARWLALVGTAAGVLLGAGLIAWRRRQGLR